MLSHRDIKKEKKEITHYSKKSAKMFKLFFELHIRRDELLVRVDGFTPVDWASFVKGDHKVWHQLKSNISHDKKLLKIIDDEIEHVGDRTEEMIRALEKVNAPKKFLNELRYLSGVIREVEICMHFYKQKMFDYLRSRHNPSLLLDQVVRYHDQEKHYLKRILHEIAPSRLTAIKRLLVKAKLTIKSFDNRLKLATHSIVGTGVGAVFGLIVTAMTALDYYDAKDEGRAVIDVTFSDKVDALLFYTSWLAVIGFIWGVYEHFKKFDDYEESKKIDDLAYALKAKMKSWNA